MIGAETINPKPQSSGDTQPQLYLGYETALLFWRAVHEGRLPFPQPIDVRTVGTGAVVGFRALKDIDLGPLGVVLTPVGVLAQYDERVIDWGSGKEGEVRRGLVPVGIATPPGVPTPLHVLTSGAKRYGTHDCLEVHLVAGMLSPRGNCRLFVAISGAWMSKVAPELKRLWYRSSISMFFGAMSADITTCLPSPSRPKNI